MKSYCIRGDHWEGVAVHRWSIEEPSVEDLEQMLERLDASTYTMMTIEGPGNRHLTVGGGAGRYVVNATTLDNEQFWTLLRSEPAEGVIQLNTGGQDGDFPATHVVDKGQAYQAARIFLQTGELDRDQQWLEE